MIYIFTLSIAIITIILYKLYDVPLEKKLALKLFNENKEFMETLKESSKISLNYFLTDFLKNRGYSFKYPKTGEINTFKIYHYLENLIRNQ